VNDLRRDSFLHPARGNRQSPGHWLRRPRASREPARRTVPAVGGVQRKILPALDLACGVVA